MSNSRICVLYDCTRLLSKAGQDFPSGIDRVDIAHARYLESSYNIDVEYIYHRGGTAHFLPKKMGRALVLTLSARWEEGSLPSQRQYRIFSILKSAVDTETLKDISTAKERPHLTSYRQSVYLNSSHAGLNASGYLEYIKTNLTDNMVFYVHDLIPIDFPEYVKIGDAERHRERMVNVGNYAKCVIANSKYTLDRFKVFISENEISAPPYLSIAHIGLHNAFSRIAADRTFASSERKNFVMLGTIEPRKNHLNMLLLWRKICAERSAENIPTLTIIGKRGWENEQVFAMLDRCDALKRHVVEINDADDQVVKQVLQDATALLFPAYVEGWGMPLIEAFALGVPVIAADIPALREAGQGLADYITPEDIIGWESAIDEYCEENSFRRNSQIKRLSRFQAPTWKTHFEVLMKYLEAIKSDYVGHEMSENREGRVGAIARAYLSEKVPTEEYDVTRLENSSLHWDCGWYAEQEDSKKRKYRWCGASDIAQVSIPLQGDAHDISRVAIIAFVVRPVNPASWSRDWVRVRVNGEYRDFELVENNGVRRIVIDVASIPYLLGMTIEFELIQRVSPKEIKIGTDQRNLAFNVVETEIFREKGRAQV